MPSPRPKRALRLLAAAVLGAAVAPGAALACGSGGYAYAGVAAKQPGFGIATALTAIGDPLVRDGHVAGWIGVGGPGAGPNGGDDWIQVGLSAFPGGPDSSLYYEVARPGQAPTYREVATAIPTGVTKRVAVLEIAGRPNAWRVWVDGKAVSPPIHLPGSHGAWRPMATAESWGGASRACNVYRYRFDRLRVAGAPGGGWRALTASYSFHSRHYAVVRTTQASFVATASRTALSEARLAQSVRR